MAMPERVRKTSTREDEIMDPLFLRLGIPQNIDTLAGLSTLVSQGIAGQDRGAAPAARKVQPSDVDRKRCR